MPQQASSAPDSHAVVFDVNVYLDLGRLLGPGITLHDVQSAGAEYTSEPLPSSKPCVDSLRAICVCLGGVFAEPQLLQVWTSTHIDDTLTHVAQQPVAAGGLGWTSAQATSLLADVVDELAYARTAGGHVVLNGVDGGHALDHEDAMVYTTARKAAFDDNSVLYRYLVTNDQQFRNAPGLDHINIAFPHEFVDAVRTARRQVALARMPRPKP